MPPLELKEWVTLIKDGLLGVAALVTTVIAIYGARVWKREKGAATLLSGLL